VTPGASRLCSAALLAAAALCLFAADADAGTSVVLALPSSASPTLLGASSDGEDIAYLAVPAAGGGGGERELHWYDLRTEEDLTVGSVAETDIGQISAEGRHLVFSAWSSGPPGAGLVAGTVYEATIGEEGHVTYEQVSPTATTYPGGGLETQYRFPTSNSDGSLVAYEDLNGHDYVWSQATHTATQVASGGPAILSSDGSVLGVPTGAEGSLVEYSVPGGTVLRSFDATPTVNQVHLYGLSADGSYGVGFGYGTEAQTGYAYLDFPKGTIHVIPNSFDGQCTGSNHSPVAISEDGKSVAFGSLATGLSPDPAGGSLGYFSYEPESEVVTNHSGAYAGPPPSGGCPSVAMSGDGQTMYFVSNVEPSLTSGWIAGTVTDEAGSPVSNAQVTFYEAGAPVATAVTRADGSYVSQGLPAGSYEVGFSTSSEVGNYASQYFSGMPSLAAAEPVQVTAGAVSREVNAHLAPDGQITGTVTGAATSAPLEFSAAGTSALGGSTTPRTADASLTDEAYIYETAISGSGGGTPPTNAAPPSISGEARQGLTLTEAHGQWLNEPTSYSYQWQQCDGYGADSSPSPKPRLAHRRSKCRKGFKKKVVKGKEKCAKGKHRRELQGQPRRAGL
jgi:hypothetical protein